ncbi:MAG: hypothetical protein P1V20_17740 [Verrucomicrobiales bacterium]|nr:hypothetical protein [Verrucomicrobiales bacterium]
MERIETIVEQLAEFSLSELEQLNSYLQLALKIRRQSELSVDLPTTLSSVRRESGLAEEARRVLQGIDEYELTLADQCLLAAVILDESYGQEKFTSRSLHDEVKMNGRPPIAHITSATSGLLEKSYLIGSTKEAHLSMEGKAKARSLVRMFLGNAA